tara:strand:- start:1488 stop:3227 length:1740 start_codon:yes stop_codon:yes gene_type:complete
MSKFVVSKQNIVTDVEERDKITLITQFYICNDNEEVMQNEEDKNFLITKKMAEQRNRELRDCLKKNVENNLITKIILLNEKKYTEEELGITSKKIKQIILNKRITFKDVFNHVTGDHLKGYVIMANADIFFDKTLSTIFKSDLKQCKRVLTPLRYEYDSKYKNLKLSKIFGPTSGTQDTWIFHVDHNVEKQHRKLFNLKFGQFNCDNKVLYLFNLLGYELVNDPTTLKTYHHHKSMARCYDKTNIPEPYMFILPKLNRSYGTEYYPLDMLCKPLKTDIERLTENGNRFCKDVEKFHNILDSDAQKINKDDFFIISKTNSIYNGVVYNMIESGKSARDGNEYFTKMLESKVGQGLSELRKKGLNINKVQEVQVYITILISVFKMSKAVLFPSPITNDFRENAKENNDMLKIIRSNCDTILSDDAISLTNKFNNKLWIENIKNKKILILTDNEDVINKQKNNLNDIWGCDVFENCEITTYPLPKHTEEDVEGGKSVIDYAQNYVNEIGKKLGTNLFGIDMVLLDETPFSWFILYYFEKIKTTTIDVGEELNMYFGVYNEWLQERYKDFLSVYKNKYWIKED